ncbi:hypothetical protein Ancab_031845 [Ancistrocladus abbreviatus]
MHTPQASNDASWDRKKNTTLTWKKRNLKIRKVLALKEIQENRGIHKFSYRTLSCICLSFLLAHSGVKINKGNPTASLVSYPIKNHPTYNTISLFQTIMFSLHHYWIHPQIGSVRDSC